MIKMSNSAAFLTFTSKQTRVQNARVCHLCTKLQHLKILFQLLSGLRKRVPCAYQALDLVISNPKRFLDALASLDLKLSVSEWVSDLPFFKLFHSQRIYGSFRFFLNIFGTFTRTRQLASQGYFQIPFFNRKCNAHDLYSSKHLHTDK